MKKLFLLLISIIFVSMAVSCGDKTKNDIKINEENIKNESDKIEERKTNRELKMVYLKEDGLYLTNINNKNDEKIIEGNNFSYPKISKNGKFIAYTKGETLYIYNIETKEIEKLVEGIENYFVEYIWLDENTIIYNNKNNGFIKYNIGKNEKIEHIDEYSYCNLFLFSDKLYGVRLYYGEDEENKDEGIFEIDLEKYIDNRYEIRILINSVEGTEERLGYMPYIYGISVDGKYLWIMEKYASGSTSADFGGMGLYDLENNTHIDYSTVSPTDNHFYEEYDERNITVLPLESNLVTNIKNSKMIGIVEGRDRERFQNKEVVLYNLNDDNSLEPIKFMGKEMVGKSPSFTLDGENLLYSETGALDIFEIEDYNKSYSDWYKQNHNIMKYNINTKKIEKLTKDNGHYSIPLDIGNNIILYFKLEDDVYSSIKLENGVEEIVTDNIIIENQDIYSYFLDICY